jgi:ABC-type sugar transport system ATPase subunit
MLEAHDVGKSYGGVQALTGAVLTVPAGAVDALRGVEGAGKSTLVKIIAGAVRPDTGVLRLDGQPVRFESTAAAVRSGVAVVSQELSLFPDLDVLSNLYPMREPRRGPFIDRAAMERRARPVLEELGLHVGMRQPLGTLSLAERQLVEVAKALITEPRVLILDEPTSALEAASTEALLRILSVLRERQVAVLFVSHILEEVMALCDEVTVLRDGRPVLAGVARESLTIPDVVEAMLGQRRGADLAAAGSTARDVQEHLGSAVAGLADAPLELRSVRLEGVSVGRVLSDVSMEARPGEIVGLAGLAGAGHETVIGLLSGQVRPRAGTVRLPGGRAVPRGLRGAISAGVALVTGDRRRFGLMLDKPLWDNIGQVRAIALARDGLLVRRGRLRDLAQEHVERLRVRTPSVDELAGRLSGGNQQKVVFAKWLDAEPSVLLLDDPTRGVDVGAKSEMHMLIRSASEAGAVILLASTDLDELEGLCDRVLVFYQGILSAELSGDTLDARTLLESMNTGRVTPRAA